MLPPATAESPPPEDAELETDDSGVSGLRGNVWVIIGSCAVALIAVFALMCSAAYACRRRKRAAEDRRPDLASVQVQPLHDHLRRKKEEADSHDHEVCKQSSTAKLGTHRGKYSRLIRITFGVLYRANRLIL